MDINAAMNRCRFLKKQSGAATPKNNPSKYQVKRDMQQKTFVGNTFDNVYQLSFIILASRMWPKGHAKVYLILRVISARVNIISLEAKAPNSLIMW